jgi:hypothetical protein
MLVYQCTVCKSIYAHVNTIKCKVCKGVLTRTNVGKVVDKQVKDLSTVVNRNRAMVVQRPRKVKQFVELNLKPLQPRSLYSFLPSFRRTNFKDPPSMRMKAFTAAVIAIYLYENQNIPLTV